MSTEATHSGVPPDRMTEKKPPSRKRVPLPGVPVS